MNMPTLFMPKKRKPAKPITKKTTTLTLSDEARELGKILARSRGTNLTQMVERWLREELVKAGKLPPDSV